MGGRPQCMTPARQADEGAAMAWYRRAAESSGPPAAALYKLAVLLVRPPIPRPPSLPRLSFSRSPSCARPLGIPQEAAW